MRKLYKSDTDKVFAGVIGGIGEYTDIDPTILRLAFLLLSIMTAIFPSVLAYIIAALIVPKKPHTHTAEHHHTEHKKETPPTSETN